VKVDLKWMLVAWSLLIAVCGTQAAGAQQTAGNGNSPAFKEEFVPVEKDVKLQVLDWGGTGRPLILLAGLGYDAHAWDSFAGRLVLEYHVYAITRRGFGASSAPQPNYENYNAKRLGDDVVAVMDAMKINRPILVGHSIAGEELSSIGKRQSDNIAGLIYLEAGYAYAYYNDHATQAEGMFDTFALRNELNAYGSPEPPSVQKAQVEHLLKVSLPRYQKMLEQEEKRLQSVPDNAPGPPDTPQVRINAAILKGFEIFDGVHCPVLAIFAEPHTLPPNAPEDQAKRAAAIAEDKALVSEQADAFQAGNPSATVVRIPNANHFIFRSNEAEVLRAIGAFVAGLPR
jgi:non-heme chloroperoxidase